MYTNTVGKIRFDWIHHTLITFICLYLFMIHVSEHYCASFPRANRVTVEFGELYTSPITVTLPLSIYWGN